MEEERRKVYVEVDVTHRTDGTARPQRIKFENGEVYEIDRVKYCCRAASTKVGGTGLRYTVPKGQQRFTTQTNRAIEKGWAKIDYTFTVEQTGEYYIGVEAGGFSGMYVLCGRYSD